MGDAVIEPMLRGLGWAVVTALVIYYLAGSLVLYVADDQRGLKHFLFCIGWPLVRLYDWLTERRR